MRAPRLQLERMVRHVLKAMKDEKVLIAHATDEAIYNCALARLDKEIEKEKQAERDAMTMVDDLERKNPGLDRRKMIQMVKRKLAEERKLVL